MGITWALRHRRTPINAHAHDDSHETSAPRVFELRAPQSSIMEPSVCVGQSETGHGKSQIKQRGDVAKARRHRSAKRSVRRHHAMPVPPDSRAHVRDLSSMTKGCSAARAGAGKHAEQSRQVGRGTHEGVRCSNNGTRCQSGGPRTGVGGAHALDKSPRESCLVTTNEEDVAKSPRAR